MLDIVGIYDISAFLGAGQGLVHRQTALTKQRTKTGDKGILAVKDGLEIVGRPQAAFAGKKLIQRPRFRVSRGATTKGFLEFWDGLDRLRRCPQMARCLYKIDALAGLRNALM